MTQLNIICLHGFTQNSTILEKKLTNLIDKAKNSIKLYYLNGPNILSDDDQRAYWYYDASNPLNAIWSDHANLDNKLHGLEKSLTEFIKLAKSIGRVDGLIGFSQGGCFADYICKLHAINKLEIDIKFAIFISAANFNRDDYPDLKVNPKINTLHIYGVGDTIITPDQSIDLMNCYTNKTIHSHNGKHVVPSNAAAKNVFMNFINSVK